MVLRQSNQSNQPSRDRTAYKELGAPLWAPIDTIAHNAILDSCERDSRAISAIPYNLPLGPVPHELQGIARPPPVRYLSRQGEPELGIVSQRRQEFE